MVVGYARNIEEALNQKVIPSEIIGLFLKYFYIFPVEMRRNLGVRWENVFASKAIKDALRERLVLPLKFPMFFRGNRAFFGCLMLYGPKASETANMIDAVCTESGCTLFSVHWKHLMSKHAKNGHKIIKYLYEMAAENSPSIVSLEGFEDEDDEEDMVRKMRTELLVQIGFASPIQTVVITDSPWSIGCAMRRRCRKRVFVGLYDDEQRKQLIEMHIDDMVGGHDTLSDRECHDLSQALDGCTRDDIECMMQRVRRQYESEHNKSELLHIMMMECKNTKTSVSPETIMAKFNRFKEEFGE